MEISGKVIKVLPLQQGVSKAGKSWSKQEFIIETTDQYPKQICVLVFNPGQNIQIPQVGGMVTASIDIESRSFVGKDGIERWSTDVKAWKIGPYESQTSMDAQANAFFAQQPSPAAQQVYATQAQPQYNPASNQFAPQSQQMWVPQGQPQQPAPQSEQSTLPF